MAVVIRLARYGKRHQPFYRLVVADQRFPRDGRYLDIVGNYNPRVEGDGVSLQKDKYNNWLAKGAQPTLRVQNIVKRCKTVI